MSNSFKFLVQSRTYNFISKSVTGSFSSFSNKLLYKILSDKFDLRALSIRVEFNLLSSSVGDDHSENSENMSILGLNVSVNIDKTLSFLELFENSISGQLERIEVGSTDFTVNLIDDHLNFLGNILDLFRDIGVADFSNSTFKEIGDDFSTGRLLTTGPTYRNVFFEG